MTSQTETTAWSTEELRRIGQADELQLASRRPDGTLRRGVTIWVVRVGDDLYVRSAYGPDNPWFRRATSSGSGHVLVGDVERDVTFTEPAPGAQNAVDAAYHSKYDRYGPDIVGHVTGPNAHIVTIRLAKSLRQEGQTS